MKISGNEFSAIRGGSAIDALLIMINEQAALIDQNINGLWKSYFIESPDSWAVPNIGDPLASRQASGFRKRY
jgi:hypothetical protein